MLLGAVRGTRMLAEPRAAVDLYWLPLGAGGHFVRMNGRSPGFNSDFQRYVDDDV